MYKTISSAVLLRSSSELRGFVAACLKAHGFKWFDPPTKDVPASGTEYTGEGLRDVKFVRRGKKLFLRTAYSENGRVYMCEITRVRYPEDITSNFIFVDKKSEPRASIQYALAGRTVNP